MPQKTKVEPLPTPALYPANPRAILQRMFSACYTESEGRINDFSPHSVTAAHYEGHLFAILEQLFFVNRLPDATGLAFLKTAGIQRIIGTAATVSLTFTLSGAIANTFTLSAGYKVKSRDGKVFVTDSVLLIPPGQISGVVSATAEQVGTAYNVAGFTITQLTETRAFLQSVTNLEAAAGGRDEETLDEARSRGFAALRRRDTLVTADDFEKEAETRLGAGAIAIAIPRLRAARDGYEDGWVHLFCLNSDRTQLTELQRAELRGLLAPKAYIGLQDKIAVSSIELYPLQVRVVADLIPGSDPQVVGQRVYQRLDEYFTPGVLPLGSSVLIKEVEHVVRRSGVATVNSVVFLIEDALFNVKVSYGDVALPNAWTAASLFDFEITLLDAATGASFVYSVGEGGDRD